MNILPALSRAWLLTLALAPVAAGDESAAKIEEIAPRIERVTYFCNALKRDQSFCVVLPEVSPPADSDRAVLFLLHGRGRNERSLVDDPESRALLLLRAGFVIVLPQGEDGWYINQPGRPENRYESALEETMEFATKHYRLAKDKSRRGICGWSMGGYGALHYAVEHPEEFCFAAAMIGLVDFPRDDLPAGQRYDVPRKRFGDNPEDWARLNPAHQIQRLRDTEVLLVTASDAFDRTMNENLRDRLRERGMSHEYLVLEGAHTFDVVRAALPSVLDGARRAFESANGNRSPSSDPES